MMAEQKKEFFTLQLNAIDENYNKWQKRRLAKQKKIYDKCLYIYFYLLTECYYHYFIIVPLIMTLFQASAIYAKKLKSKKLAIKALLFGFMKNLPQRKEHLGIIMNNLFSQKDDQQIPEKLFK